MEILDGSKTRLDEGDTAFVVDPTVTNWRIDGAEFEQDELTETRIKEVIADGASEVRVGRPCDLILTRILGHQPTPV